METLKVIECKGFTKEEAFADLQFIPDLAAIKGCNATQAWIKAGKPVPGSNLFKRFAIQQLTEKTKNVNGLGLYIVLEQPIMDTRKRPYSIVNNVAKGTRSWTFKYQVREDEIVIDELPNVYEDEDGNLVKEGKIQNISISKIGVVVGTYDSKQDAIEAAKSLTILQHKNFSIIPIKVPDITPVAAYCLYTPAAGTRLGTYVAFGYNKID